ncbi:sulfurtransferase complex subunit TusC [Endozoicomonadaceae bacterium StTr2]
MDHSLCVIMTKPPYGSLTAREALDSALVAATYDLNVTLLFLGDGVLQLLGNQNPADIQQKNLNALHASLPLYGIERLVVDAQALKQHNLTAEDLVSDVEVLEADALSNLIDSHTSVVTF